MGIRIWSVISTTIGTQSYEGGVVHESFDISWW